MYLPIETTEPPSSTFDCDSSNKNNQLKESLTNSGSELSQNVLTSSYRHIPVASRFRWTDDYYAGKHEVVAVCERDSVKAGNYRFLHTLRLAVLTFCIACLYFSLGLWLRKSDPEIAEIDFVEVLYFLVISAFFVFYASYEKKQQLEQHVAVTNEGIRIDQSAMTTVIPFESILFLEAEPTTKYCCERFETKELSIVIIERSLGLEGTILEHIFRQRNRKIELYGIYQYQEFVELVDIMRNSQTCGTYNCGKDTEMTVQSSSSTTSSSSSSSWDIEENPAMVERI